MQKELNYFHQNLRSYWQTELVNLIIFIFVLLATVFSRLFGQPSFLSARVSNAMTIIAFTIIGVLIILLFGRIHRQAESLERFRLFMGEDGKQIEPSLKPLYDKCRKYYHSGKRLDHVNGVIALGIICGYLLLNH
ncbi:hypothetical protein [Secundilactobacillus folii]|uniref:Uncharacterized protein n=1 Tax=Secundilactobacillus folii TaxID=2678357 RepID=A0A7X2XU47_9LACO|nr:hypothetical protein [Secundilactobacillus folii]MTV81609.1 hypothetical protein [Secundilactobacillus folii]